MEVTLTTIGIDKREICVTLQCNLENTEYCAGRSVAPSPNHLDLSPEGP